MHINNFNLPRPAQEALDQCFCVYIGDPEFHMKKMRQWCYDQNLSLAYCELQEVSDVSPMFDNVVAFWFIDPADATAFTLKFK